MARACGTRRGGKIFVLGSVRQRKKKKEKNMEAPHTDGTMILKWIWQCLYHFTQITKIRAIRFPSPTFFLLLFLCCTVCMFQFIPLTSNDPYSGHTAPLTSKRCILYIYSTNTGTEYFKHSIYCLFFPLQNSVCFINLTYLVPVLFTFYIQVC